MNAKELDVDFSYSDFDDRMDLDLNYPEDDLEDQEPSEEEDSFYRPLEEY